MNESAELSKLLFEARENIEMFADIIEARGSDPAIQRRLVERIDSYRASRGWSPDGFGGEDA